MSSEDLRETVRKIVTENEDKAIQVIYERPKNIGWFLGTVMKAPGGIHPDFIVLKHVEEVLGEYRFRLGPIMPVV